MIWRFPKIGVPPFWETPISRCQCHWAQGVLISALEESWCHASTKWLKNTTGVKCSKAREEPELDVIEFYGLVTEKLQDWANHMLAF